MKKHLRLSLMAMLMALAMVAAACGVDNGATTPDLSIDGTDEPAPLPRNPNPDQTPLVEGTCYEDEPDCSDTPVPGEEPSDLPPPADASDEPVGPTGMLVDGGVTVSDALEANVVGIIAVQGFLLVDNEGARLCELLAESAPPQCGGASIAVTGYEEVLSVPLGNSQGVTWTDESVSFMGEIVDGVLVVNATVA